VEGDETEENAPVTLEEDNTVEDDSTVGASALDPTVSITACEYSPSNVTLRPGDEITVTVSATDGGAMDNAWGEYSDSTGSTLEELGYMQHGASETFFWDEELAGYTFNFKVFGTDGTGKSGGVLCSLTVTWVGLGGGSSPQFEGIGLSVDTHEGALAANKQISITGHQQQAHTHYALVLECASGSVTIVDGTASGSGNYSGLYKLPAMAEGTCTLSLTSTGEEGATYRLAMQLVVDAELRLSHIGTPVGSVTAS
jgi:hypothetical protein